MSVEDVRRFYARLAEDKALMEELTKAGEALKYRLKTKEDFEERGLAETFALIEPLAREAGCPFTMEDMKTYVEGGVFDLTESEMEAISAGGTSLACFIVGNEVDSVMPRFSKDVACFIWGESSMHKTACIFIGAAHSD